MITKISFGYLCLKLWAKPSGSEADVDSLKTDVKSVWN
jgi:hypothetical protein